MKMLKGLPPELLAKLTNQATAEQKAEINAKIVECLDIAANHFGHEFTMPEVIYDLKGRVAGTASSKRIRVNLELLSTEWDNMLNDTIPHEVAHTIVRQHYGNAPKPHGYEWRRVMISLEQEQAAWHQSAILRQAWEGKNSSHGGTCFSQTLTGNRRHVGAEGAGELQT